MSDQKIITYKCRNCGGPLTWDADRQRFHCAYCGSDFTSDEVKSQNPDETAEQKILTEDADSKTAAERTVSPEAAGGTEDAESAYDNHPGASAGKQSGAASAVIYICPSCGAELVTDETTAASFCYYCHNPVVLKGRLSGAYLPDEIIPFAISRDEAVRIFTAWIGQKKFVPKQFYSEKQIEKLSGIYFPYWSYSCRVHGKISAEGTKLRSWTAGDRRFTEHRVFSISHDGDMDVQNVQRLALSKANRRLVEGVLPFQYDKLVPFQLSYLQGFFAERRDMEQKEFEAPVENEVEQFAKDSLKQTTSGFAAVKINALQAERTDEQWRYALLPVWTMTYRAKGDEKLYYFSVNGQTGKICGELPVDSGVLLRLFLMVAVPALVVLLVFWWFI